MSAISLHDVTVGIKAFIRIDTLSKTIESLIPHNFAQVIVADDGPADSRKDEVYDKFSNMLPLKVIKLPFDTGEAAGKNKIVDHCKTEFLLMLDDDEAIRSDVGKLKEIILLDKKLGGVSSVLNEYGRLRCGASDIFIQSSYAFREYRGQKEKFGTDGNKYMYFDFIPNCTLFRLECLKEQAWDPSFKIGSAHEDFYFMHKSLTTGNLPWHWM